MTNCEIIYVRASGNSALQNIQLPNELIQAADGFETSINTAQIIQLIRPTNDIQKIIIKYPNSGGGYTTEEINNPNFS